MSTVVVEELVRAILSRLACVTGPGASGNYAARCPFHDDHAASFSLHAKSGLWRCHAAACGRRGNAYQLAEELAITAGTTHAPPVNWGLDAAMTRFGVTVNRLGVVFPLVDHAGVRHRDHVRLHAGEPRFQYWGKGLTLHALVDWSLLREWGAGCGIAYIVEGNRDWLTLAAHGWPVIGILGTEHFALAREEAFDHIRNAGIGGLIITPDNDPAGEKASSEWARILRYDGFAVGIRTLPAGVKGKSIKDMFDLYQAVGERFNDWMHELPVNWT
jgi:CHC2 zinc finger/Toprim-like